jgi:hypothetical protein
MNGDAAISDAVGPIEPQPEATALEHDPEKWELVFRIMLKQKAGAA